MITCDEQQKLLYELYPSSKRINKHFSKYFNQIKYTFIYFGIISNNIRQCEFSIFYSMGLMMSL